MVQEMKSEKRFLLHLGVFLLLIQGLLAHSTSSLVANVDDVRAGKRLKISNSNSRPTDHVGVKSAPHNALREDFKKYATGDPQNVKDVVQLLLEQEKLMKEADSRRSLVKRFVTFLRAAYPREIPMWSEVVQNRVQQGTGPLHRKRRFLIKSRRHKQQSGKDKDKPEPKMQTGSCGCKSVTECPDQDEPDKFRMFFSNPPLCRPAPTPNPIDDIPSTDICGHSCMCHYTEPPTTDNDKEIFVGHRKTTDYRTAEK